ncbi:MAG: amino acid ABC transporter substrate-binding protein [Lachnospiraceae bacterium]|nr:amino acid ABC transporter substrate-binding protein [Lachnospiraceae bacterium]
MKKWKVLAAACCMALLAAACSGAGGSASGGSASSAAAGGSSQEAAAPDSTETGGGEDAAFETVTPGKLTMSTNAAFPPYEMTEDDGSFSGIDVEIAEAIAAELGLELQIDDMDFDAALLAVQQGKSDMVMAGVTVNEERMQVMDFSDSYSTGVQVIIVPEGSDIASVEDLAGHMIGTQRGTTGNIYCTDEFGEDHVVAYDNGLTATQALLNGQIDCIVIDSAPAAEFVKANPGLTILDTEYAVEDYAIGLNKENPALKDAVNVVLNRLIANGTVQSIVDKYINAQ